MLGKQYFGGTLFNRILNYFRFVWVFGGHCCLAFSVVVFFFFFLNNHVVEKIISQLKGDMFY